MKQSAVYGPPCMSFNRTLGNEEKIRRFQ